MSEAQVATPAEPPAAEAKHKRTGSTAVTGVYSAADLEAENKEVVVIKEVGKLNWKMNTSPTTCQEPEVMKKFVCNPPMNKIDLTFDTGMVLTARNRKGVTVKDCLDVIWKQFRKKADDEMDKPILDNFNWNKDYYGWGAMLIVQKKEPDVVPGKKKK